jgi:hypothetical protein
VRRIELDLRIDGPRDSLSFPSKKPPLDADGRVTQSGLLRLVQCPQRRIVPLGLTETEVKALVEFLHTLAGEGYQDNPPTSFPR